MRGAAPGPYVAVPEEWRATSFFGRIVTAGLCAYAQLSDGSLDMEDIFEMHRMLDFEEYCEAESRELASRKSRENDVDYR